MEQKSEKHADIFGTIKWRLPNGKLHRLDGPAIECANGEKWWYVDGRCHRLDGPAIEWNDGDKWWYVNGERYLTFQFYLEAVKPLITEQEYFILLLTYGTEK